jgi:hypothetical protein
MSMPGRAPIYSVVPVDRSALDALVAHLAPADRPALPVITDRYQQENCDGCGCAAWLGPRAGLARQLSPGPLLCFVCIIRAAIVSGGLPPMVDLGGGYPAEGTPIPSAPATSGP